MSKAGYVRRTVLENKRRAVGHREQAYVIVAEERAHGQDRPRIACRPLARSCIRTAADRSNTSREADHPIGNLP